MSDPRVDLLAVLDQLERRRRHDHAQLRALLQAHLGDWGCLGVTSLGCDGRVGEGDGMAPLLLTRAEVAGLLRLSERQVARAVAEGRLRAVHEGRAVRFRPSDLEDFVRNLATTDTATSEWEVR